MPLKDPKARAAYQLAYQRAHKAEVYVATRRWELQNPAAIRAIQERHRRKNGQLKAGSPELTEKLQQAHAARWPARFWAKIDKQGPRMPGMRSRCWVWTGHVIHGGYGHVRYQGKHLKTHRVAYELLVGPIPEGLTIDHLCFNPACVRPEHLEPVTIAENIRRSIAAGRR